MKAGSKITQVGGKAIALSGNDIDTDRIIPARFMKVVTFDGLGEHAFSDDRAQARAAGRIHPLDTPAAQGAHILVVNKNFGCGSSREHAPQALKRWGIDALVGESFAEIFAGNCVTLGMPLMTGSSETIQAMQKYLNDHPGQSVVLDVESLTATASDGTRWSLEMPKGVQSRLLTGDWDSLGPLLGNLDKVQTTIARVPYLNGSFQR